MIPNIAASCLGKQDAVLEHQVMNIIRVIYLRESSVREPIKRRFK